MCKQSFAEIAVFSCRTGNVLTWHDATDDFNTDTLSHTHQVLRFCVSAVHLSLSQLRMEVKIAGMPVARQHFHDVVWYGMVIIENGILY